MAMDRSDSHYGRYRTLGKELYCTYSKKLRDGV